MAQPGNLLSDNNESVETSVAGWGAISNCTVAQSGAQFYLGTKSLMVTPSTTTTCAFSSATQTDQPQGLAVGATYDAYVWVFSTVASTTAWWTIDWRTAANAFISSSDQTSGAAIPLVQNTWTLVYYRTVAAPATTTQATLNFNIDQVAATDRFHCDLFFFGNIRPNITQPSRIQPIVRSSVW